jgi:diguanylate cyclase (GGDEF)-like protein
LAALAIERSLAERALASAAQVDPLTGLPNRSTFLELLGESLRQPDARVAVMFLDLDGFKHVNDSLGHAAGDELLRQAAERLNRNTRADDIVARLGGDEFLIALPFVQKPSEVAVVSARLVEALSRPFALSGGEAHVSASIGVSMYPDDGEHIDALVASADAALYAAKANGKGLYHFPAHARALRVA